MSASKKMMLKQFVFSSVLASSLVFASGAYAQLSQQTGIADPGRAEQRLKEKRLVPQVGPDIQIKKLELQQAPAGAENIKFDFGGLSLDGANAYTEDQLAPLYENMIGTEVSLADIYAVANRMTLQYRNDGYILTQVVVPPQTIENGIPRLQIVEGFIDNVIIQGGTQTDSELKIIQEYASRISRGGALNIADMERQLLLINDLPGVTGRSVISPSRTTAGGADMLVIIERDPYDAVIGANNHGSRFLGPFQLTGAGVLNSPLNFNEAITGQFVLAPDAGFELAFGSIGYEQPVGPWGTKLGITASITDTDPGFTLAPFEVEGLSKSITVKATHPFVRSRNTNVFGRLIFDWRDIDSKNNVEATRQDRIRAVRAGVQTEFLDNLIGVAVNTVDLQISQGVNILGASDEKDANLTRALGDPSFTKGNITLQRLQRITSSVNLLLEGRGQLSNNPLLSSEEFAIGGISTVRGYDPSEVVGDDGIAGKVELQWNTASRETQLFGFLDGGTVWDKDATTSTGKRNSLASTGAGVRVDLPMQTDAEFIAALPLHRDIQTRNEHDIQFFLGVNKEF